MKKTAKLLVLPLLVSTAFLLSLGNSITYANSTAYVDSYTYESDYNSGDTITLSDESVEITEAGSYTLKGTLSNGQVVINVWEDEEVEITLNGVNITSKNSSAFYVQSGKATIILADGTTNYLTDTSNYEDQNSDEEPDATLFAKEDLKIKGSWKLVVDGNFNDAIKTKDDLKLKGGTIVVISVDDGIVGNDSIEVDDDVTLKITAEQDGLKSNNEDEGTILIEGGDIDISAGDDGIKAYSDITINSWNINISNSYEGIEAERITINDWNINIKSSDDGINITNSAEDQSQIRQSFGSSTESEFLLTINGWEITIDASGDWVDANGSIQQNGGILRVDIGIVQNGPAEWAIDYDNTYKITNGEFIAFGGSQMSMTASDISIQNALLINFDENVQAGSTVSLKDSSGNIIFSTQTKKEIQSVAYSSSKLTQWETYTYFVDGTEKWSFTFSNLITKVWNTERGMRWGRGGNMQGGQMRERPDFSNSQNSDSSDRPTPPNMWDNSDFEEMRTIIDKQRNGETLTTEEEKLTEFEANRPQMGERENFEQNQNNQSFGWEKKSELGNSSNNNSNSNSTNTLNTKIEEKVDVVVDNLVDKISDYENDKQIKILETILEKIEIVEDKYSSNTSIKSLFNYLKSSINNAINKVK